MVITTATDFPLSALDRYPAKAAAARALGLQSGATHGGRQ
jgi:hypothetical protein